MMLPHMSSITCRETKSLELNKTKIIEKKKKVHTSGSPLFVHFQEQESQESRIDQ